MTWKNKPYYDAPANLAKSGTNLTWTAQQGTLVKYSVYAVPDDISVEQAASTIYEGIKGDYLLGISYSPNYTLPRAYQEGFWYAVCVIDGYGNESEPAYLRDGDNPDPEQPTPVTYNIEKVWEINNLSFLNADAMRQGFGMDGKFYINDKSSSTILVVGPNGLTGETFEGGRNVGLSRDQAGNLVVSDAQFPSPWNASNTNIKVINPATGAVTTYTLPSDVTNFGRCDLLGFARGNLLENGEFFIVGGNSGSTISRITISNGELDEDNTYLTTCNGVSASTGTVLNAYTDAAGNEAVVYVNRSSGSVIKMLPSGDNFVGTTISMPNKGNCNGTFPFVWNGKDYLLYPTLNNYHDGFAVAEPNAAETLVYVPQTVNADANTYQANWLNAEVIDSRHVTIYQYFPGGHITVWSLTKQGGLLRGDVNEDGTVNISDVTALIKYLLSHDTDGVNLDNADCDRSTVVNINDVTCLINYLLSHSWPE